MKEEHSFFGMIRPEPWNGNSGGTPYMDMGSNGFGDMTLDLDRRIRNDAVTVGGCGWRGWH